MPSASRSCDSSGGVRASADFTAPRIAWIGSSIASRISSGVSTIVFGMPLMRSRPANLGLVLVVGGEHRADGELHLFGGALTDGQAVLAAHVALDGGVDVERPDPHRLERDDATEGDHRDLAGATADVDDHVAERLVDRERRADRGGHGLLDEERLGGAGTPRGFEHRPLLDVGDRRRHADRAPAARCSREMPARWNSMRMRRWVISKSVIAPPRRGRTATM